MKNQYFVYILTNKSNEVLYIGVTNNIERRSAEHKLGSIPGFSKKYNLNKVVYCEELQSIKDAIYREKQLKNWRRQWKIELITKNNPQWKDLCI